MTQIILYYLTAVFLVLTGVYLLTHKHVVAGGWTLAGGVVMLVFGSSSSNDKSDGEE